MMTKTIKISEKTHESLSKLASKNDTFRHVSLERRCMWRVCHWGLWLFLSVDSVGKDSPIAQPSKTKRDMM